MALISLCMIVGNEAAHIVRCLSSFSDTFDELSLVVATGSIEPDETEALATEWCREKGKLLTVSRYVNGAGAEAWPHVDNFATARNAAFAQACGDWLFWADADDIIEAPEALRAAIENTAADALFFQYRVPGTNKAPMRERVISRRLWREGRRWVNAVHENIAVLPTDSREHLAAPVWVHAPLASKPRSHDRNLRILSRNLNSACSELFYAHAEHVCAGSRKKAREIGLAALAMPNLPDSFRLEIMLNMGRTCDDNKEAVEWFGRAYAFAPHLREPLAGLALTYMSIGDHVRCHAAATAMIRIPEPEFNRRSWAHEAKWYGWAGDDLFARACRLVGEPVPPHVPPRIALLHATRGRESKAWQCREAWLAMASKPEAVEYVMAVDSDDEKSVELARQFNHVIVEPGGGCVRAWNAAAMAARADVLIQLSDDWTPTLGWDDAILAEFAGVNGAAVLAVGDGHRKDDLLCMAIVNRARLEQQSGVMFSSAYQSVYSDNEFSHRAWRDGVVIDARERIAFTHDHPAFGVGKMDSTYAASNSRERYIEGWSTFCQRNPDAPRPAFIGPGTSV